ncbi:MAG: MFS transporter [Corynebacteriales bacterium]|nr:MFS transporter [Mycobacteriales bacterium]
MLFAASIIHRSGALIQPFLLVFLTNERGLSVVNAGTVASAWGLGAILSPLLGGWFADHLGRIPTIMVGMVSSAMAAVVLIFTADFQYLIMIAFATGIAAELHQPAAGALSVDTIEPDKRPRVLSLMIWSANVGTTFAVMAGGYLASVDYALLFVINAIVCLIHPALVWRGARDLPRYQRSVETRTVGYKSALRDPLLVGILFLAAVLGALVGQVFVGLPLAVDGAGLSEADYGLIASVCGVVIFFTLPLATGRTDKYPRAAVLSLSALLLGVGWGATMFAHTVVQFSLCVIVWTLGEVGLYSVFGGLVEDLAPAAARARYQGLFWLAFGSKGLTAPLLGTRLYEDGGTVLWWVCAGVGVFAAVGFLLLAPAMKRRIANA